MDPFAGSNCEICSERWVSLELVEIVLDSARRLVGINRGCRSKHRAGGQQLGTMAVKARRPLGKIFGLLVGSAPEQWGESLLSPQKQWSNRFAQGAHAGGKISDRGA